MMKKGKISASMMCADLDKIFYFLAEFKKANLDFLHIDVMDGQFVPNITFGPNVVKALRPVTKLTLDVHLMIVDPERYIEEFANAGADIIGVHVEATNHIHRALQMIKAKGVKAEVALNPGTSVSAIVPVLDMVDQVLVMTVNPGFGGQSFIESTLDKIRQIAHLRAANNLDFDIQVDGGIVPETAKLCKEAGADVLVAGSYIYNATDVKASIDALKEALE